MGMIILSSGKSFQWSECLKILDMDYSYDYCIITEGVAYFLIKLNGLFDIQCFLEYIPVFDSVYLSMGNNDLVHPNKLLRIIGEYPWPIILGRIKNPIISFIQNKGEIIILFDGINRILCLFFIIIYQIDLPITINQFTMAGDILKYTHLGSTLIN